MYRKQIGGLLSSWNWGEDDLFQRYGDNLVVRVVKLLNGQINANNDQ